jgi:cysteine sulfinate desulfinase/cysteine desulfurase-like protein
MGLGPAVAQGAIRLTLGRSTTPAQIETAAAALITGYRQVLARRGGGPG